ncbi:uncharacterized protein LOC128724852 [Anopheles nili]|uniref:uncharacterized protein LOC128724852 n=1 Tax=Anopheles nili TaxID=185578 RepID=UPI00237C0B04|nr:uncharacterized protein LOC128724852 [Anopheles nili]
MRKFCLLILLPLTVLAGAGRLPAAVFEDVYELGRPNAAFLATTESRNGMKAYLRKKYRQTKEPHSQTSTMAAYTAAHERYQNLEEKQNDRIRVENLRKLATIRTKRLDEQHISTMKSKKIDITPREVIKFELSDAMVFQQDINSKSTDNMKSRSKREDNSNRIIPVPKNIIRFELSDAMVTQNKGPTTQRPNNSSNQQVQRHRRSASPDPRDYVKFELEDAKHSEQFSQSNSKISENLRHPFASSDSYKRGKVFDEIVERLEPKEKRNSRKEKRENAPQMEENEESDMSPEESRRVKVRGKKQKHIANYEDLPLGVQKAIDIALNENERLNGKGRDETNDGVSVQSTPRYFFGDKKTKTKKSYSVASKTTEAKFVPSAKLTETKLSSITDEFRGQSALMPAKSVGMEPGALSEQTEKDKSTSLVPGIPKAWWSYSDLRRPKRLYHKHSTAPLVINPQYVNTFKPSGTQGKMNDLSPGYHHRPVLFSTMNPTTIGQSSEHKDFSDQISNGPEEVVIKERPKIQYVIKEIPIPVKQPLTKITVQPSISISYDKHITSPESGEGHISHAYDNPYGPLEVQYGHREPVKETVNSFHNMKIVIPEPKENSYEQEHYYNNVDYNRVQQSRQAPKLYPNEIDTTGGSIAALSALIGQQPSIQLKKLNELLRMPSQPASQEQKYRPQESTAPVTFPDTAATTPKPSRPGYRSVQVEPTINYEDNRYQFGQNNPLLEVPISTDYKPIKEVVTDIVNSDLFSPAITTPTYATYDITSHEPTPAPIVEHQELNDEVAGHESNAYGQIKIQSTPATLLGRTIAHHYQEQHHHHHNHRAPSAQHFDESEGYAFGYRVRDFHTGNDFGHVQNHDNGVTRGEYHILLPDGRVQNVRYTADEKGFHADVTYESVHPASHH